MFLTKLLGYTTQVFISFLLSQYPPKDRIRYTIVKIPSKLPTGSLDVTILRDRNDAF